jgi:hypothetical protein
MMHLQVAHMQWPPPHAFGQQWLGEMHVTPPPHLKASVPEQTIIPPHPHGSPGAPLSVEQPPQALVAPPPTHVPLHWTVPVPPQPQAVA